MVNMGLEPRVACVIPTYNGYDDIQRLIQSLNKQVAEFDLIVVDSSSSDGTYEFLVNHAKFLNRISADSFNHGGTRQLMVDTFPDYDVYVFLTQDSELVDRDSISKIVGYFADKDVGAVCGRQIPHLNASPIAKHARYFNYPERSVIKSIEDIPRLGIKTVFMSNSFSAYSAKALNTVGGFPSNVIFGEDMYVAAKIIMAGFKVAYAGDALCRHSHNYSVGEEFSRYFDMGVFHAREPWIRNNFGGAGGEGGRFVKSEILYLIKNGFSYIPGAMFRSAIKLIAYKIGQYEKYIPIFVKQRIGMYKKYWNGPFARLK